MRQRRSAPRATITEKAKRLARAVVVTTDCRTGRIVRASANDTAIGSALRDASRARYPLRLVKAAIAVCEALGPLLACDTGGAVYREHERVVSRAYRKYLAAKAAIRKGE
jgi:hypothetical protein